MKHIFYASLIFLMAVGPLHGASSSSITTSQGKDIRLYNQGVELMLDKKFTAAEKKFRQALSARERFAQAHNNLAYVLRKQGPARFKEALEHYNRAIRLDGDLAQPYMHRGVLFVQMGQVAMAGKDLETLKNLDASLANELAWVIENGREKEPERFFGVSRTMN